MDLLREKHSALVNLFEEHAAQALSLQRQALQEIVPDVALQLNLSDEGVDWVVDYLYDLGSLFRMFRVRFLACNLLGEIILTDVREWDLKRQKLIASFTHEALRDAVLWRLSVLKPTVSHAVHNSNHTTSLQSSRHPPGLPALRCLPLNYLDKLGRPIAVLRVAELDFYADPEELRREIILTVERMRVALQRLNERISNGKAPVLQYVIVMDVEDVSMKTIPVDLVKWYLREVHPWYYGMVGAAFIVNTNWAHSGLWGILKHLLPASAISKVAFPSRGELSQFIHEDYFPMIYEFPSDIPDTYHEIIPGTPSDASSFRRNSLPPSPSPSLSASTSASPRPPRKSKRKLKKARNASRFSIDNPFFGYPIDDQPSRPPSPSRERDLPSTGTGVPTLRHGRRRKRDLVRALLFLYWQRWRTHIGFGIFVLLVIGVLKMARMRWAKAAVLSYWGRAGGWARSG